MTQKHKILPSKRSSCGRCRILVHNSSISFYEIQVYTVHCTLYRAHVLSLLKLESYAGHQNGGQKGRWTEGMHDKMDAGEKGCMTEGMHERRDARQKGCTTKGMRDIRDAWPEQKGIKGCMHHCITEEMHDRSDA